MKDIPQTMGAYGDIRKREFNQLKEKVHEKLERARQKAPDVAEKAKEKSKSVFDKLKKHIDERKQRKK